MNADQFWTRVDKSAGPDECWPWLGGQNGNGRGRVQFAGRMQYAYRIAWELTCGEPIPADLLACHTCGNPICVNPAHIFIGTVSDNMADAKAKGRLYTGPRPSGLEHHNATLHPDVIASAVAEYRASGVSQADVARRYGVAQSTFSTWLLGEGRLDAGIAPGSKPFKPCGTHAAYARHLRRGEIPCAECRVAERTYNRKRKLKKRGTRAVAA